jgi:hypothetical protein
VTKYHSSGYLSGEYDEWLMFKNKVVQNEYLNKRLISFAA